MIFEKIRERLQEQLKAYEEFAGTQFSIEYENKCEVGVQATKEAIDIINQVEAEYNNGWISVDDKLPEKSGKYFVTQKVYSVADREFKKVISIQTDFVEFDARDNKWSRARFLQVTHWQPLPQPPKGE